MEQVQTRVKAASLPSGKLVEIYIQLRDRRAQRKARFENEDADDKTRQEKIEGLLLQRFNSDGVTAVSAASGTAFTTRKVSVTTADGSEFLGFCQANNAWELADVRPNKNNIAAYREEHNDLPPGVNWTEIITVNVRRN